MLAAIIVKIGKILRKPFPKVATDENDTVRFWRDTIYFYSTIIYAYAGFILLLVSGYANFAAGLKTLALVDVILYVFALSIMISQRFTIETRCKLLSSVIYVLGVSLLLYTGPFGAGLLWLFMFPVFVGIMLGIWPAYYALIINIITLVIFSIGLHAGMLDKFEFSKFKEVNWVIISLNFLLVDSATTIALTVILMGVKKSLEKQSLIQQQLQDEKSKLENARQAAEENNLKKSALLANLSHELRTPMNAILGFSSLMNTKTYPPEKQALFHSIIQEKGKYLLQLVNDLIDYSKIEAKQLQFFMEPCELASLFDELEVFYKEESARMNKTDLDIKFVKSETREPVVINIDITRLKQIMINLLSNALKFTEHGSIEFGYAVLDEKTTRFYVKDTGMGIDKGDQAKIFFRFEQLLANPQLNIQGYGLGLHITKNIVSLMSGKIWVESELNKGSCFYVEIPYHSADQIN